MAYVSERPEGGDFSIVEGEPTEGVHLAFAAGLDESLTDPDGNTVELVGVDPVGGGDAHGCLPQAHGVRHRHERRPHQQGYQQPGSEARAHSS